MGFSVGNNRPYTGTIVPSVYYKKDRRVISLMIEVNRSLYMDEVSGTKTTDFDSTKIKIEGVLKFIGALDQQFKLGVFPISASLQTLSHCFSNLT
jgi:N-formylglutamate amidohydrolase